MATVQINIPSILGRAGLAVACVATLLACGGCGGSDRAAETAEPTSVFDLTGVPLSSRLATALHEDARAAGPDDGPPWRDWAAELALCDELVIGVQRPAARQQAADRLYAAWRGQPRNLLWIQTAVRYEYLMHRAAERDAIIEGLDAASPAAAFARGNILYGRGSRGEEFLAAAERADELEGLDRVLLELKLAMVESDGGDPLRGVDRLLAVLPDSGPGGPWLRMRLWYDIARYLWRADRLDDALHAAEAGRLACEATDSDRWRGRYLILWAGLRKARRETEAALILFEESSRLGETRDLPWIFQNGTARAAGLCSDIGDAARALRFDRRALARSVAIDDSLNVPRCMINMADDFRMLGRIDSCRVYQELARVWVDAYDDVRNRAHFPIKAAEFECQLGNYALADSLLELARSRSPGASLPIDEATLLLRMIEQGLEMGQPDVAYRAIGRLAELRDVLHDDQPDQNLVAGYEIATAEFLSGQGEYVLAGEALARARAAVDRGGGEKAWHTHRCAGDLALRRGDLRTAETEFSHGLDLARRMDNPGLESASRFHLGHCLLQDDRPAEARALFTVAADSGRFGGRFRQRLETLALLGRSLSREGRPAEAEAQLRRAESLLTPHTPPDLAALVRYELGGALAALGAREDALANLRDAKDRLDATTRASSAELQAFTGSLRRDIVTALVDLRLHPPGASPGRDDIRSALSLALALKSITVDDLAADGACAAAYLVGRVRSYLWIVGGDRADVHELPGRDELARLTGPVLADMTSPLRRVDGAALARLSDVLLGPVLPAWEPDRLLRISSDDLLAALPWGALSVDAAGTPALARGPIIEAETRRAAAGGTSALAAGAGPVLAVGLDGHAGERDAPGDLRHAEVEARTVAALWPASRVVLRTGAAASWNALAPELRDASVLHLATHAVVHQGASERASLRLASDAGSAPVTLRSLADLDLQADLIYLSCCEGARASRPGAGLTGFARAFLAAGARTVVASAIRVDDEASGELARLFYAGWLAGADKASALRAAKLALREARPEWAHPYYWSFYRIIGEAG